jgi:hypothetical protein
MSIVPIKDIRYVLSLLCHEVLSVRGHARFLSINGLIFSHSLVTGNKCVIGVHNKNLCVCISGDERDIYL